MGRIRDSKIKTYAKEIVACYPDKVSLDFEANKQLLNKIGFSQGKQTRNRIAGYIVTYLKTKDNTYENIKRILYENKKKRNKNRRERYGRQA